jgi:hypothetical protein
MSWTVPVGSPAYAWGGALLLALPLLLIGGATWWEFGHAQGGSSAWPAVVACSLIIVVGVALLGSMRVSRAEIDGEGRLVIRGSLYRQTIDLSRIDRASIVAHDAHDRPSLWLRTNGIGLPGYSAGWFRGSGGKRTFVVYGDGPHVSFRTVDGTHYVVGATDADEVARALAAA